MKVIKNSTLGRYFKKALQLVLKYMQLFGMWGGSLPNKHFGTKVRTMVRFFVPLWSQSSQQKAFPTENFLEKQKVIKYLSLNDFCVSNRILYARLGSNLPAFWQIFFFFLLFFYYLGIFFDPPKKSRDAVKRNPQNTSFQN